MGSRDPSQSVGPSNTSPLAVPEAELITVEAVINDGLDLVLVFALDQFGWWLDVIGAMLRRFAIRREETGVEQVVDFPGVRQLELIRHQ
jgi:hypothetical protein